MFNLIFDKGFILLNIFVSSKFDLKNLALGNNSLFISISLIIKGNLYNSASNTGIPKPSYNDVEIYAEELINRLQSSF